MGFELKFPSRGRVTGFCTTKPLNWATITLRTTKTIQSGYASEPLSIAEPRPADRSKGAFVASGKLVHTFTLRDSHARLAHCIVRHSHEAPTRVRTTFFYHSGDSSTPQLPSPSVRDRCPPSFISSSAPHSILPKVTEKAVSTPTTSTPTVTAVKSRSQDPTQDDGKHDIPLSNTRRRRPNSIEIAMRRVRSQRIKKIISLLKRLMPLLHDTSNGLPAAPRIIIINILLYRLLMPYQNRHRINDVVFATNVTEPSPACSTRNMKSAQTELSPSLYSYPTRLHPQLPQQYFHVHRFRPHTRGVNPWATPSE